MAAPLPEGYSTINSRCQYTADAGLTCPIQYEKNELLIRPYFLIDDSTQKQVVSHLQNYWVEYTHEFIDSKFSYGDMLYVAALKGTKDVIGTVAIDRRSFIPFVGTLFVVKDQRNKGFGKILLNFAEVYIRNILKFSNVHLWCEEEMLDFYFNLGYSIESKEKDKYVLVKNLI